MNKQIQILLIMILLHRSLRIALLALRVLLLNQSLRLRPMLKLMLIYLGQKKVKKDLSNSSPPPKKKKSRGRKVRLSEQDIETPPLASIPISKKEKQSSEFPLQDEQSRLKKVLRKLLRRCLIKSLALSLLSFTHKMAILKHWPILRMMSSSMTPWK